MDNQPQTSSHTEKKRSVKVRDNWPIKRLKVKSFLVPGVGNDLETMGNILLQIAERRKQDKCEITLAGEETQIDGERKVYRFLYKLKPGHLAVADLLLKAHQGDVYVEMKHIARTQLSKLRRVISAALIGIIGIFLLGVYWTFAAGARESWNLEYASKHAPKLEDYGYYQTTGDADRFVANELDQGSVSFDGNVFLANLTQRIVVSDKRLKTAVSAAFEEGEETYFFSPFNNKSWNLKVFSWAASQLEIAKQDADAQYGECITFSYGYFANDYGSMTGLNAQWGGLTNYATVEARMVPRLYDVFEKRLISSANEAAGSEFSKYVRESLNESISTRSSVSMWHRLAMDPRLAFMHFGMVIGVIVSIGWALFRLFPPWMLRYPARMTGMPTPDDFQTTVQAHMAWLESVVNEGFAEMGIDQSKIVSMERSG